MYTGSVPFRPFWIWGTRVRIAFNRNCAFSGSRNSSTYFISPSRRVLVVKRSARGGQRAAVVRQKRVYQVPQNVVDDYVAFLHPMDAVGFDHKAVIQAGLRHLAAAHPGQPDGGHAHLLRFQKSPHKVVRVPAGRETYQAVAGSGLSNQLADEDVLESDVVGYRAQHRAVGGQIDRGPRDTPGSNRVQKLDGHVRRVAAGAAVAHRTETAVAAINLRDGPGGGDHLLPVPGEEFVNDLVMMIRLLPH